ncbi:MAG: restriction endonuclease subunit S [Thermodesulfovibrionales bacterium]
MIVDLNPYAEYKASDQAWIGMIPAHWSVLPNRAIFSEVKDRNHPDEEMLSVTITKGIIRQKALLAGSSKKDSSNLNKSAYKLVCPQDIAYNKMQAWQGAIGVSDYRGIVSPAYVVVRLREEHNPRYFHHLYRTSHFAKEAERWSYGITSDMWSLRPEHFKMIYTPLPSADEQAAIVRFLDHAKRRIDRFIRAKKKVIALLNEQKQAIIHSAVTRGLDPNVKLKPSGITWLGDIPAHWEVRQLRRLSKKIKTGGTPTGAEARFFEEGGFNWYTPADFKDSIMLGYASRQLSEQGVEAVINFPINTILMIGIGATIGKVSISNKPCSCNQQINAILPNFKLICPEYLVYYLRILRNYILKCGKFTTMPIINQDETKRLPALLPPINEQSVIAVHIEKEIKPFTDSIARTEREIALMQEYRTRLIADVVTGKLDVREAAKKLPDEAAESDIIDEDEISAVDEEITNCMNGEGGE